MGLNPENINQEDCINIHGGVWRPRDFNFDHIGNGLLTLFIMASLEAWP